MVDFANKYPSVFHYTSVDSFELIWKNNSLRATHPKFLNDTTELRLANDFLQQRLRSVMMEEISQNRMKFRKALKKAGSIRGLVNHESKLAMQVMHDAAFEGVKSDPAFPPFLISFSNHQYGSYEYKNGLLSMWRSYGRDGVAFELDSQELTNSLKSESSKYGYNVLSISDVIYQGKEKIAYEDYGDFDTEIAKLAFDLLLKRGSVSDHPEALGKFLQFTCRYKHRAFFEESESRIVAIPHPFSSTENPKPMKTIVEDTARKYIDIFFDKLPVKSVIISPGEKQNEIFDRIKSILGQSSIRVAKSETPYLERSN